MSISGATLASVRTKRNIGTALKDRRADAAVRLAAVRERHGEGACDVIEQMRDGYRTTVDDLRGPSLIGLARAVHGAGRLRRSGEVWVVYKA